MKLTNSLVLCLLFVLTEGLCLPLAFAQTPNIILVIDPGHGGKDPGKPKGSSHLKHEKDINLDIALKLGSYIKEKLPQVKVLYTRDKDEYLSLEARAEFANNNKADYFISIHANSSDDPSIHGTESHIYSHQQKISLQLANLIEAEFKNRAGRKSRGVIDANRRGHNLYVTQYTQMPSVLVEVGYITNPTEEQYLNDDYGQAIIASAIFRAFRTLIQSKPHFSENRASYYRVQILATQKPIDLNDKVFEELEDKVEEYKTDQPGGYRYKYLVGREYDPERARALVRRLVKMGFKDAFIIEMKD